MPSRSKKGKKALRDSKATNDFFNQVDTNAGPKVGLNVCPCCNNSIQKHAIRYMKSGSSSDNNVAEPVLDKKKTAASLTSLIQEKFISEGRQKWQSLFDAQNDILDLEGVKQALKLAYERMKNTPVTAYLFPPPDTFDMGNLERVEEVYDSLCKMEEDNEEREMAELAGRIRNLAVTASDVKQSSEDRLRAKLDIQNLNIHSKITVPLSSCLRQIQLFNMDKKFGFMEEALQALHHGDKKRRGEDVEELQLSFRQKLNDPSKLMESASEENKKKNSLDDALVNFQSLDDALDNFQRNLQTTTEEFLILKKTVSDAERPIEPPSPPSSFKYKGIPVPEGIPDHIHQCLFDTAFLMKEVVVLQKEASEQHRDVQRTLATWYHASQEVWEYGKAHIHEMPRFREYEYTRNSLHAMYRVVSRLEVKIVKFYSSEGASELPQAMNKAFTLGQLSLKQFGQRWEKRCLKLQEKFPSVDQIVIQMEDFQAELLKWSLQKLTQDPVQSSRHSARLSKHSV